MSSCNAIRRNWRHTRTWRNRIPRMFIIQDCYCLISDAFPLHARLLVLEKRGWPIVQFFVSLRSLLPIYFLCLFVVRFLHCKSSKSNEHQIWKCIYCESIDIVACWWCHVHAITQYSLTAAIIFFQGVRRALRASLSLSFYSRIGVNRAITRTAMTRSDSSAPVSSSGPHVYFTFIVTAYLYSRWTDKPNSPQKTRRIWILSSNSWQSKVHRSANGWSKWIGNFFLNSCAWICLISEDLGLEKTLEEVRCPSELIKFLCFWRRHWKFFAVARLHTYD